LVDVLQTTVAAAKQNGDCILQMDEKIDLEKDAQLKAFV